MRVIDRDYVVNYIRGYIKSHTASIVVLSIILVYFNFTILKNGYVEFSIVPIIGLVVIWISVLYMIVINIIAIKISYGMLNDFENFSYQKSVHKITYVTCTGNNKPKSKRFRADYIDHDNLTMSNINSGFVDVPNGTDLDSLIDTNLVCLKFGNSDKARKLCFLEACNDIQL